MNKAEMTSQIAPRSRLIQCGQQRFGSTELQHICFWTCQLWGLLFVGFVLLLFKKVGTDGLRSRNGCCSTSRCVVRVTVHAVCYTNITCLNTTCGCYICFQDGMLYPQKKLFWSDVSQMLSGQGVDLTPLLRRGEGVVIAM